MLRLTCEVREGLDRAPLNQHGLFQWVTAAFYELGLGPPRCGLGYAAGPANGPTPHQPHAATLCCASAPVPSLDLLVSWTPDQPVFRASRMLGLTTEHMTELM